MKICWSNLEHVHLTRNGFFRKGSHSYIERPCCKECGEPYLVSRFKNTDYCSPSCARKNRKITNETKSKISSSLKGNKKSKEECLAIAKRMSKGGVVKRNIALCDTYAHQLIPIEEVRDSNGVLEVKCALCNNWFIPKRTTVEGRAQFIKGNIDRESRLYCSDECKLSCPVFNKHKYPKGTNPRNSRNNYYFTESQLRVWAKEVLKRADYKCEYCGEKATIAHHEQPKKLEPFYALDPDNGIACCKDCHYKFGHKDECSTINIAKIQCSN